MDKTNSDPTYTLRNALRHLWLFPLLEKKPQVTEVFQKCYGYLEKMEKSLQKEIRLLSIEQHVARNADWSYQWLGPYTGDHLVMLLQKLSAYKGVSRTNITELLSFLTHAEHGYRYRQGINWVKSHGNVYVIKAEQAFWQSIMHDDAVISPTIQMIEQ